MSWLSHPLVGRDSLLSGTAVALLVVLTAGTIIQYLLAATVFVDDRALGWTWLYDWFVGLLIVGVGIAWIVGIVYGWGNGGPLVAVALPVIPTLLATAVGLRPTVNIDLAVAFGSATVAIWLAAWATVSPGDADRMTPLIAALGGVVSGIALFVVWRGTRGVGLYTSEGAMLAWILFAGGVFTGLVWAIAHWRVLRWPDWRPMS